MLGSDPRYDRDKMTSPGNLQRTKVVRGIVGMSHLSEITRVEDAASSYFPAFSSSCYHIKL